MAGTGGELSRSAIVLAILIEVDQLLMPHEQIPNVHVSICCQHRRSTNGICMCVKEWKVGRKSRKTVPGRHNVVDAGVVGRQHEFESRPWRTKTKQGGQVSGRTAGLFLKAQATQYERYLPHPSPAQRAIMVPVPQGGNQSCIKWNLGLINLR